MLEKLSSADSLPIVAHLAAARPALCDHLTVVECNGEDAAAFLHGQFSNDVTGIVNGGYALAAYLNPKGRILGLVRILRRDDRRFLLLLDTELTDTLLARLRMFVLRAKVEFQPRPDLTILGSTNPALPAGLAETLPGPCTLSEPDTHTIVVAPGRNPNRFLVITDRTPAESQVLFGTQPGDRGNWLAAQAVDGIAEVFPATSGEFLPQAVNLDLVEGVNFRKGCYPGQEIVARLRYLGKQKQRMIGFTVNGTGEIATGSGILCNGRKVGSVVLATGDDATGGSIGLVSVTYAGLDTAALTLEDGTACTAFAPPYRIGELEPDAGE